MLFFLASHAGSTLRAEDDRFRSDWVAGAYSWGNLIKVHDFEGDGAGEIVYGSEQFTSSGSWVRIYIASRDFLTHYCWGFVEDSFRDFTFHDVDGDGVSEILVAGGRSIHVLRRSDCTVIEVYDFPIFVEALDFGDFDADAVPDIAFTNEEDLYAAVWNDLDNAVFRRGFGGHNVVVEALDDNSGDEIRVDSTVMRFHEPSTLRTLDEWPSYNGWVHMAELDGVPPREVVRAHLWNDGFELYRMGQDEPYATFPVANLGAYVIKDIDGDGMDEIVYGDRQFGSVFVLESDLTVQHEFENPNGGTNPLDAGDLDGDGLAEVVWGSGGFLVADLGLGAIVTQLAGVSGQVVGIPPGADEADRTVTIFGPELQGFRQSARALLDPSTGATTEMALFPDAGVSVSDLDFVVGHDVGQDGVQDLCTGYDFFSNYRIFCRDKQTLQQTWAWSLAESRQFVGLVDTNEDGIDEYVLRNFDDLIIVDSETGQIVLTSDPLPSVWVVDVAYRQGRLIAVTNRRSLLHFDAASGDLLATNEAYEAVQIELFDGGFAVGTSNDGVGRYDPMTMTISEWFDTRPDASVQLLDGSPDQLRLAWSTRATNNPFDELIVLSAGAVPRAVPGNFETIHQLTVANDSSVIVSTRAGVQSFSVDRIFVDGFEP